MADVEFTGWKRFVLGRKPKWTLLRSLILLLACFFIFKFLLIPIRITGISMEPTYRDGRIKLLNRQIYRIRAPERGDIVGIQTSGPKVMFMKRIIGLPGERVEIRRNQVFINGEPLEEPYVVLKNLRRPWNYPEVLLRSGEYFVIGDNRGMDQHLHEFGEIEAWRIYGKAVF